MKTEASRTEQQTSPELAFSSQVREESADGTRAINADLQTTQGVNEAVTEALSVQAVAPGKPVGRLAQAAAPARAAGFPALIPHLSLDDRIGRLLLSMVLAALLWFYVLNLENPPRITVFNDFTLEMRGLRSDLKVINFETLPPVGVTVQAPETILNMISKSDIKPYLDLTELDAGVHNVPVGIEVREAVRSDLLDVSALPNPVQIQLEVQVSRVFSVSVRTLGTPAFGYGMEPTQLDPSQVEVIGSQNNVDRVAQVMVSVDVGDKDGTQSGLIAPQALDSAGNRVDGVTFRPESIQVVVPIKLLINSKGVPVRVPVQGAPAAGYRISAITSDPISVIICCSPEMLEPIQFLETTPITITGTTSNVVTTTQLLLPAGVTLSPGQSSAVTVRVNVEPLVTTLQVSVATTVDGLPPGTSAIVSPDRLELTLAGTFAQLQGLRPSDVSAFVNVSTLEEGTYELAPRIIVPQGIKLESASSERVTVTLIAPTAVPATFTPIPVVPTREATVTLPNTAQPSVETPPTPVSSPSAVVISPAPVSTSTIAISGTITSTVAPATPGPQTAASPTP